MSTELSLSLNLESFGKQNFASFVIRIEPDRESKSFFICCRWITQYIRQIGSSSLVLAYPEQSADNSFVVLAKRDKGRDKIISDIESMTQQIHLDLGLTLVVNFEENAVGSYCEAFPHFQAVEFIIIDHLMNNGWVRISLNGVQCYALIKNVDSVSYDGAIDTYTNCEVLEIEDIYSTCNGSGSENPVTFKLKFLIRFCRMSFISNNMNLFEVDDDQSNVISNTNVLVNIDDGNQFVLRSKTDIDKISLTDICTPLEIRSMEKGFLNYLPKPKQFQSYWKLRSGINVGETASLAHGWSKVENNVDLDNETILPVQLLCRSIVEIPYRTRKFQDSYVETVIDILLTLHIISQIVIERENKSTPKKHVLVSALKFRNAKELSEAKKHSFDVSEKFSDDSDDSDDL